MILQWLREDFETLLRRDPRTRVALWYDTKREFAGLLAPLEVELAQAGLALLALDPSQGHGPLWVKWASEVGPAADRKVVIWLPNSRDDLAGRAADGLRVDCLLEYRYSGFEWLIEGKTPTLFGFLKSHKVSLPTKRSDQDALWRGDAESLLVKYTLANLDRDEVFWTSRMLTASVIRDAIVGDVEERLLRFLTNPTNEAHGLAEVGIGEEFITQVERRYGERPDLENSPDAWAHAFTTRLVLLEVFTSTGEGDEFPYLTRLPGGEFRERWLEFLAHWMRDLDHVEAFIRYAEAIDTELSLAGWLKEHPGMTQSLLSLVRSRWDQFIDDLKAIDSGDELREKLLGSRAMLEQEAAGFWAEVAERIPAWKLSLDLCDQL
ncbi:MAG: hypothetical protein KAY24_19785, partial [Candidatus Eisenbacteria sp.]|nr:hypothetical protein [Candidatus Eisenbacteria bacterium]